MSNQYIEAICTLPQDVAFGFSAEHSEGGLKSLSIAQRLKIEAGVIKPETATGIRHIYAREAARWLGDKIKNKTDKPMTGIITKVFNLQNGAWTQFSLPPTSNKSVWFQGSIALSALAAYTGKKDLAKKAKDLYSLGVNTPLKTDIGSIQSAAKNVYRKIAKAAEKAGLSSSQSQVKFVLNHLRNYAKVSEIVFGKNLSIQSSSDVTFTQKAGNLADNQKRAAAKEEANKVKKARGLDVKASVDIPFKNKIEGNVFRSWVNDNHRKWAKKNDLSRSGAFNNSYIKKAWKRWGQDYREAMAQKLFMERKNDDIPVTPAGPITVAPMPVSAPIPISNEPLPFDDASMDSDPFADEDPEVGMMALLQDDPEEFLKQYWYVPVGGFVGIIGLALGIRVLTK